MSIGVIHSADEPAQLFRHLRSLARHRLVAVPFSGKAVFCSVSATVDINLSIFFAGDNQSSSARRPKNTVS
jgi:hypothetical protein